jgi:hypothetical protein
MASVGLVGLVGIDETSLHCKQTYLAMMHDRVARRPLFCDPEARPSDGVDLAPPLGACSGKVCDVRGERMEMRAA